MKVPSLRSATRTSVLAMSALVVSGGAVMLAAAQDENREQQTAERIVDQTAAVTKGEIVWIDGSPRDLRLLEELATEVRKNGAFPLVTITTDRMIRQSYTEVPAEFDSQPLKLDLALADLVDVQIAVGDLDAPELIADVPNVAERRTARGKAFEPVSEKLAEGDLRFIEVNNGLYPTAWRAKRYGMREEDLERVFWQGVNVDYANLQARGRELQKQLQAGKEVRITSGGGTNLTVQIAGRPVLVSDGIISAEDKKRGGTAAWAYLPAGEVYVTPVAGTAQGKVVIPEIYFDGREVRNLALTFKEGKVTSMEGSGPGYAGLKATYDAYEHPQKGAFGLIDFGINENLKLPLGRAGGAWAPAGTVTVGFGGNTWAGGDNRSSFGVYGQLLDATVTVDGRPIVAKGRLAKG
jgi:aminopeptidase